MVDSLATGAGPRWRLPAVVLLALVLSAGVGICLYLTWFHEVQVYGDRTATLANCPITETVNCEAVNTSDYSELLGTPISALGMPTYLLLLGLGVAGLRRPRLLAYAFAIGLLTVLYSGLLYYISSVKIGLLCAWCMRLYAVNLAGTVLAGVAAWRNPLALVGDVLEDLLRFPREMRLTAAAMAALLVLTVAGDRLYRADLAARASAAEAAASSVPAAAGSPGSEASAAVVAAKPVPLVVPGPLKRLSGRDGKLEVTPFDLKSRIGKGRPVALIFYEPGYSLAEDALTGFVRFMKAQAPQMEVFAVAGRGKERRPEMLWESFCLLNLPPDLPLLMDDDFAFAKQADALAMPDLVLVNGRGEVVAGKIMGLKEEIPTLSGTLSAGQLIRQVAEGGSPRPAQVLPTYYPATELYGGCAPAFSLPELSTGRNFTFTGVSPNGKPTFLMFWSATCTHCQKEIPLLVDYFRSHPDEFNMVSVAMIRPDRPDGFSHRKVTEEYVRMKGIPWTVLDDSSGYANDLYKVISTPTTFLISPGGEIVDAWYFTHREIAPAIQGALSRLRLAGGACTPRAPASVRRASFSVVGPDGVKVDVDALARRPSILHLWATWCAPCQEELPGLLKFRKTLEKKGGELLLVSVEDEESRGRVRDFGSRFGAGFTSFLAPQGGLAEQMDLSYTVPRTFLMSPGGSVIRELYGVQHWEDPQFQKNVLALLQLPGV